MNEGIKIVCQNKKAYHEYFIEENMEAGIILAGTEVKSLRLGQANLKDSYAVVRGKELFLVNTHISPYKQADKFTQPEPERARKLLLHRREISRLIGKIKERGYTLIPTKIYLKNGIIKVEIGLAKGKKLFDKRDALKKKTIVREMEKEMKSKHKT